MLRHGLTAVLMTMLATPSHAATPGRACEPQGVRVQVLGSGGPELVGGRASSSYLVWIDGKARALVDLGGGAVLRFGETGAAIADLDVLLFTHLHVDHSADLPALVKASLFQNRDRALPIYGPPGNRLMPSTVTLVREMFNAPGGTFRYLSGFVNPMTRDTYKLQPHDVLPKPRKLGLASKTTENDILTGFANERLRASAVNVAHGDLPALAWRIQIGEKSVVFSGDTNGDGGLADGNEARAARQGGRVSGLTKLASGADLLVAHNAVPEDSQGAERHLHMPPSIIGRIAKDANVKQLVLSHRMQRTLGREPETLEQIRRHYAGPAVFANDLDCFAP